MNELDIIKEMLNQLVNWKNAIEANSKSIDLLPPSTNGNKLVAVHNQTSLETEKFDLSAALQGFNQLNDKITALGTITRVDNTFTFSIGYQWILNSLNYANTVEFEFTINLADTGKLRTDIVCLDTTNSLILIQGFESTDVAQQPETPPNTLLLCVFNVTDSLVNNPITNTNKLVKKINGNSPYTLIQSDTDRYLLIETEFDLILPLGLNDNSEFVIKNISGSNRELTFDTNIEFKGSSMIPNNALCFIKKIDFDGTNDIYSVNYILGKSNETLDETAENGNVIIGKSIDFQETDNPFNFELGGVTYQLILVDDKFVFSNTNNGAFALSAEENGADAILPNESSPYIVASRNWVNASSKFKGKFTTFVNLQAAHPTANAGDSAQVDAGAGINVVNYNWDEQDGWVVGGDGSGATNTDELIEGSTNKYFTENRVLATILSGISFVAATAITATDSVLQAFGKLQAQIGLKADKSMSAYSMRVNKTDATANAMEVPFIPIGSLKTLDPALITFNGTASPSSPIGLNYCWSQMDGLATGFFYMNYATTGVSNGVCTIELPPDMPKPIKPSYFNADFNTIGRVVGSMGTTTGTSFISGNGFLRVKIASSNTFQIDIVQSAINCKVVHVTIQYPTQV